MPALWRDTGIQWGRLKNFIKDIRKKFNESEISYMRSVRYSVEHVRSATFGRKWEVTQDGRSTSHKILNMVYPLLDFSIAFFKLLIPWDSF